MTDHDWDNPITCESVGAQPPEHPNGESTVSSTAIPEKLIRAVTDAYLMALRQGDLHAALGLMTQLANTYGLVAVRGLAAELATNLHTHWAGSPQRAAPSPSHRRLSDPSRAVRPP
ncbi:hypothetical protein ACIA78_21465 [Streptomyces xanthochromogenes]|uniref:hypothetical protein n=1 Tax=Streptomyces xanthochromogenes TaxID=67384 RepID=UPI003796EEA4